MKKIMILMIFSNLVMVSCYNKRERNIQYMPDMYESEAYEPYSNVKATLKPVDGTIPRGFEPYELYNTNDGYELSKSNKSPINDENFNELKAVELFTIYCSICHGKNGDGQGVLVQKDKYSGVPNFKDRVINEGSIFHVITYGKGVMGSHSSQLKSEERWQVSKYVMKLKNK